MVTTVTLNASIDKAYVMERKIENGTVMRVKEVRNTAGGKGLNVAKVVRICGADVLATGFAGGFNGRYLEALAAESGVKTEFYEVNGETRSCINILDPEFGSTEYLEPGFTVEANDLENFMKWFPEVIKESAVVTMSGSAPQGVGTDIYRKLTALVREAGARVILDTSGDYLKEGLSARPDMIKPNGDEIEALLGRQVEKTEDVIEAAKELHESYKIPWVVISLGGNGALLACDEGVFHGMPPKLTPVNTVGCGDSMVGAFAVAMEQGKTPEEALRYAVSVSAAAAMSPFTGDFDPETYEELYKKTTVARKTSIYNKDKDPITEEE
ncbi:MAG: 1-phosphofructokinase [Lachnospiraceae bacterium]|nr:1-phosphofructokinase [Lachnospiraceae bacterium]